jgi:hypothetical protein
MRSANVALSFSRASRCWPNFHSADLRLFCIASVVLALAVVLSERHPAARIGIVDAKAEPMKPGDSRHQRAFESKAAQQLTGKFLGNSLPYIWQLSHPRPVFDNTWNAFRINAVVF